MKPYQARALVTETFPRPFDKGRFRNFAINLLHRIDESKAFTRNSQYIKNAFRDDVQRFERLGTYESPDQEKLDVLVVYLTTESKLVRARTAIRNFVADHLKERDNKDAALVAFVSPTEKQWRFSYVKMEYAAVEKEDGKVGVQTKLTPARRSSYIVGEGESCHTAQSRFLDLLQDTEKYPTLAQIEDAFSVEAVTREFFEQYRALFLGLKEELDELAKKDKTIGAEFAAKQISTTDFAKKLMGQIVFLYFLQKKGWLGVPRGGDWGDGPHNFLRQLFDRKFRSYKNFFNDILELLFYDTLATDRGHEAWCEIFNCRIPFLNGGLFEPLRDYDWEKTDIIIPNSLFSNTKTTKAGDTGTGILDVFDRYNFTVNEAEPLEKEVAIDPEMLGKVFENLLEVKERKSKGSFYTPREIVHYMCQESLINYLDTQCGTGIPACDSQCGTDIPVCDSKNSQTGMSVPLIPHADIETFIHSGDQASYYEAVRVEKEKNTYSRKLPKTIETHARLLDDNLADIAVCDPAIGSGAFPVGMMQEIVRARSALTPYLKSDTDIPVCEASIEGEKEAQTGMSVPRSAYHFKRHAIQNCLYGVDIDPGAVEIAKLRLWLSLVVDEEDVKQIKPLPNLDYKVVVGNSLMGFPFKSRRLHEIEKLKARFFEETDHERKATLKQEIDQKLAECFASSKRSLGYEVNFDFEIYFSEIFHQKKGFDVVIGNPPYAVSKDQVLREIYSESVFGRPNLYGFFIHASIKKLISESGVLAFINPRTLLTDSYFSALRRFILKYANVNLMLNIVDRRNVFDEVLQSCIVDMFSKRQDLVTVRVKNIETKEQISDGQLLEVPKDDFVFGAAHDPIFIVAQSASAYAIFRKISKLPSFQQMGLAFTTGKIQWDLFEDVLTAKPTKSSTRLIWAENIQRFEFANPRLRADKLFITTPLGKCEPIRETTIAVQRTTAVEQPFRIIATIVDPKTFGFPVQAENHTSYLEQNRKKIELQFVLALLNSRFFDYVFRHINSNTQVSAGELNSLPFPQTVASPEKQKPLIKLVDRILAAKQQDAEADVSALERAIDELVYALYGLTPEEIKLVEERARK